MKRKLVDDKILRRQFAMHLWNESIDAVTLQSKEVAGALFRTLTKLGVALPLGHTADAGSQDMLVIMRLDEKCDGDARREFDRELESETRPGDREVTLKWKFDKAGPPNGLVERVIASCHVLGKVKSKTCWRYGAVFKSHCKRSGVNGKDPLYTVALSMTSYNDPQRELTARIVGPLDNARVWAATRYVASAVVTFSKDWPGALWEGWPVCGKQHDEKVFLASSVRGRSFWCLYRSIGSHPSPARHLLKCFGVFVHPRCGRLSTGRARRTSTSRSSSRCGTGRLVRLLARIEGGASAGSQGTWRRGGHRTRWVQPCCSFDSWLRYARA